MQGLSIHRILFSTSGILHHDNSHRPRSITSTYNSVLPEIRPPELECPRFKHRNLPNHCVDLFHCDRLADNIQPAPDSISVRHSSTVPCVYRSWSLTASSTNPAVISAQLFPFLITLCRYLRNIFQNTSLSIVFLGNNQSIFLLHRYHCSQCLHLLCLFLDFLCLLHPGYIILLFQPPIKCFLLRCL
ncbi:hypothetical protein PAPYR_11616 [Paratrimastix pyriformis]|uniref:Uncharacterized protein n=1 Tax=Paratrimastix pyriformis TaxID=342808 RepID=A0ABQ8U543_9EUKA|nr:hypothetical protein PAPYR_11616 [Paratrimastix pyriformis]